MFINSPAGFFQPPKLIQEHASTASKRRLDPFLRVRSNVCLDSIEDVVCPEADLDVEACARRVVSATLRCDEFLRFPFVAQKIWNSNSTRRKRFLSPKQARSSRRRREIHPVANKKRRCPTTIVRAPLFFLSWCSSTPSRRRFRYLDVTSSKRRGECVCVDIRKNISLCHCCLFLPTIAWGGF